MSRIKIAAYIGQFVAASLLLGSGAALSPAAAQSSLADQTCRAALGDTFTPSSGTTGNRCCMVVEEQSWYEQNGVVISRVYLRADQQKVRPKACSAAELAALLGAGSGTQPQPPGQGNPNPPGTSTPPGKPNPPGNPDPGGSGGYSANPPLSTSSDGGMPPFVIWS